MPEILNKPVHLLPDHIPVSHNWEALMILLLQDTRTTNTLPTHRGEVLIGSWPAGDSAREYHP